MANNDIERAPKTVKSMPVKPWETAVSCATKRGEQMGDWLARAITNQANLESGDRVILPDERPVSLGGETAANPVLPPLPPPPDLLQALAAIAAASGRPVPKDVAGHAYALTRAYLRAGRRLPPAKPRKTPPLLGQTVEESEG